MDRSIEIVKDGGNVPGDFVDKLVFAREFYHELGIEFLPPSDDEKSEPDPQKGWIDPLGQDDTTPTPEDHRSAVKKAAKFDR